MRFSPIPTLILILILTLIQIPLPTLASADLASQVNAELGSPPPSVSPALRAEVQAHPVILISGVMGDLLPGYFAHNVESLHDDFGQPQTSVVRPSSCAAIEQDAIALDARFREVAARTGKSLLVIGHSKGGVEALLSVLEDPSLVRNGIVDKVVLISGAVGGSPVADHDTHDGQTGCLGVRSLVTSHVRAVVSGALGALAPDDRAELSRRVFYVRSEETTDKVTWVFKSMSRFLWAGFGPNDGALVTADQSLPDFGNDLGTLETDHTGLVGWGPYTRTSPEYKRGFTRALIKLIFGDKVGEKS
jgi:hypothetical protein